MAGIVQISDTRVRKKFPLHCDMLWSSARITQKEGKGRRKMISVCVHRQMGGNCSYSKGTVPKCAEVFHFFTHSLHSPVSTPTQSAGYKKQQCLGHAGLLAAAAQWRCRSVCTTADGLSYLMLACGLLLSDVDLCILTTWSEFHCK